MEKRHATPRKAWIKYLSNFIIMGWVGGKFQSLQQHGHVQGMQVSIQLIRIIRCPGSLLGFLEAPLWLEDFEPEGFINYLGVIRYV